MAGAATVRSVVRIAPSSAAQTERDTRRSGKVGRGDENDPRSAARHDRDRILYSSPWQRLAGVTQVVTPEAGGALTHSRLTHSLKVAQLARSIAELLLGRSDERPNLLVLGGLDADVAEACALAHDLGHPPFGHLGEGVLDEFARGKLALRDGFEGNAQTFRIVARLDKRSPRYTGMDLTAATRCAVLKYPWARVERDRDDESHHLRLDADPVYDLHWTKFGYYHEEEVDFRQAGSIPKVEGELQSVEAAIMDLADDITYALHDLQDFYFAGFLPIPVVLKELRGYMEMREDGSKARRDGDGSTIALLADKLARDYGERFDEDLLLSAVKSVWAGIDANFAPYFDATPRKVASVIDFVSEKIGHFTSSIRTDRNPTIQRPAVQLGAPMWHQVQVPLPLSSRTSEA
jgi:dGTPase